MPELMPEMELINALLKKVAEEEAQGPMLRPARETVPQMPAETTIGEPVPQGYDPEAGLVANLGRLANYQAPGANPEVPTLKDAMLGVIMGSGGAARSLGRTAGGGNARVRIPEGRTAPKPLSGASSTPPMPDVSGIPKGKGSSRNDTLKLLRNVLDQTKENIRKNPTGVFPTGQSQTEFMGSKIEGRLPHEKGNLAEVFGTAVLSDVAKARSGELPGGLGANLKAYPVGAMRFNPVAIAKSSKNPEEFARNLLGTLAHEASGHIRSGEHSSSGVWKKNLGVRKYAPGRTISDYPTQAQTEHAPDFSGQVQMDIVRNRMMETPLAEALLKTAGIKDSPINKMYYDLKIRGGE